MDASTARLPSSPDQRLDPFDRLMLVDDRPGHPMAFFIEFHVAGPLDESRLRMALDLASRRHPRFRSRLAVCRGAAIWQEQDSGPPVVWNPAPSGDVWRPFDLRRAGGARCIVLPAGDRRHRVILQVHHAVCDGIGAFDFADDLWAFYAGVTPRPFANRRERPSPRRLGHGSPATGPATDGGDARRLAGAAWAFARFRPAPLAMVTAARAGSDDGREQPPYRWIEFDAEVTTRFRDAATRQGGTLNDLVIAATMRAARAWNARGGGRPGNVRITMPVSLRPPGRRGPARNCIGYAFLDRAADRCEDPLQLTASLAADTRWVLDHDAARVFLDTLGGLARAPAALWLATRLPLCFSTAVVSNAGELGRRMRSVTTAGDGRLMPADLLIERCIGVPPLRPGTRAAVGVATYAGRLTLCCLCSAHASPTEGATLFLDLLRAALEEMESL